MKKIENLSFKLKILGFVPLIFLSSCQSENFDAEFIDKYGQENFNEYLNTVTYFRSTGNDDNLIFFFNSFVDSCDAPFIVTVDKKSAKAVSVDTKLCKSIYNVEKDIDTTSVKKKVEGFLKYKIAFLKVDLDSIIYVNVDRSEQADLIRLPKSVSSERFQGFKNIKDNWYSKK